MKRREPMIIVSIMMNVINEICHLCGVFVILLLNLLTEKNTHLMARDGRNQFGLITCILLLVMK